MSKPKVTIKRVFEDPIGTDFNRVIGCSVWLNGEFIGCGSFGGEPEDNLESRDYAWVLPLITDLVKELDCEVEETEEQETVVIEHPRENGGCGPNER
jgi:hypothetical protein